MRDQGFPKSPRYGVRGFDLIGGVLPTTSDNEAALKENSGSHQKMTSSGSPVLT